MKKFKKNIIVNSNDITNAPWTVYPKIVAREYDGERLTVLMSNEAIQAHETHLEQLVSGFEANIRNSHASPSFAAVRIAMMLDRYWSVRTTRIYTCNRHSRSFPARSLPPNFAE